LAALLTPDRFSGVAWAYSGQPENINVVTCWESIHNYNSDQKKCPTRIHFNPRSSEVTWGHAIADAQEPLKWFKLLLIDKKDLSKDIADSVHIGEARNRLRAAKKTAEEVTAEYLKVLWKHTLTSIRKQVGRKVIDMCQFRLVLTLPAIWPHYAQVKMEEAAKAAGILHKRDADIEATTLAFVSEPEAAALATLHKMVGLPTVKVCAFSYWGKPGPFNPHVANAVHSRGIISSCVMLVAALL
jgi:hypothetical protein